MQLSAQSSSDSGCEVSSDGFSGWLGFGQSRVKIDMLGELENVIGREY